MKTSVLACIFAAGAFAAGGVTVDFPTATGDIAIVGTGGWAESTVMPAASDLVRFVKSDAGRYTASEDVEFGSIYVSKSAVFDLHTSGNHTVKLANFAVAADGKTGVVNGGTWDISGTVSGTSNNHPGSFGPCNDHTTANATLILSNACVVTNVRYFVLSNGGAGNRIQIADSSKVYAQRVHIDSYLDGKAASTNGMMEVLSGGGLKVEEGIYIGQKYPASCGNRFVASNAVISCSRIELSGLSNSVYIAGSQTSFTTTIDKLPRYSIVGQGAWNRFELDGVKWCRGFSLQTDTASSSNTIRFVNGAVLDLPDGGIFSGTNHIASCGNRIYFGDGAALNCNFVNMSRADNVVIVSNASVSAVNTADSWSGIHFGAALVNVDVAGIDGNGLVLQGDAPSVSAVREITFKHGSFLRYELPADGYRLDVPPVTARAVTFSADSSLEVVCPPRPMEKRTHVLISTTAGITVPAEVLAAANASLAAQIRSDARLELSGDGKTLCLAIRPRITSITVR